MASRGPKHFSPRVVAIALFDLVFYDTGKRTGRNASLKFVNYLGFFLEQLQGNKVVGGLRKESGSGFGAPPAASFPMSIRLME